MKPLTKRQERVLRLILRSLEDEERPPTTRELAAALGCHVKTVYQHILALERKGCITRCKGRIRAAPELREDKGIPLLGRVAAGAPILAVENREGLVSLEGLFGRGDVFAVRVDGESMKDAGILKGDLAIVRATADLPPGAIAVCYLGPRQEVTIKRLWKRSDGFELVPDNEAYLTVHVPSGDHDFRVGGQVIGVIRRLD